MAVVLTFPFFAEVKRLQRHSVLPVHEYGTAYRIMSPRPKLW